jgi:hypothetical protein
MADTTKELHNVFSRAVIDELGYRLADFIPSITHEKEEGWKVSVKLPGGRLEDITQILASNSRRRKYVEDQLKNIIGGARMIKNYDKDSSKHTDKNIAIDMLWGNNGITLFAYGDAEGKVLPVVGNGYASLASVGIKDADVAVLFATAMTIYMNNLFTAGDAGIEKEKRLEGTVRTNIRSFADANAPNLTENVLRLPNDTARLARAENGMSKKVVMGSSYMGVAQALPQIGGNERFYYTGLRISNYNHVLEEPVMKLNASESFRKPIMDEIRHLSSESDFYRFVSLGSSWGEYGPFFDCSGNACNLYPDPIASSMHYMGGKSTEYKYECHNVDSPTQAIALMVPFLIYLRHLYTAFDELEKNPGLFSDSEPFSEKFLNRRFNWLMRC